MGMRSPALTNEVEGAHPQEKVSPTVLLAYWGGSGGKLGNAALELIAPAVKCLRCLPLSSQYSWHAIKYPKGYEQWDFSQSLCV